MWRTDVQRHNLPDEDFRISDSHIAAVFLFDDDDNLTGTELNTQPAALNQYNRLRDVVRHYAVPYREFAAGMVAKGA